MPPVLVSILISVLRWALGPVFTWLVDRGVISASQTVEVLAFLAFVVGNLIWIAWSKIKEHRILNTALAATPGVTLSEVKQTVEKDGKWASALTPSNQPPVVTQNAEPKS